MKHLIIHHTRGGVVRLSFSFESLVAQGVEFAAGVVLATLRIPNALLHSTRAALTCTRPLHAQLPALERLDVVLYQRDPYESEDTDARLLSCMCYLGHLTALTLRAGHMRVLRHLRLPPSLKARSIIPTPVACMPIWAAQHSRVSLIA